MKLNKVVIALFFLISILALGCKKYKIIETDEYYFKFPEANVESQTIKKDTTNVQLDNNSEEFSVWVIRRNKNAFLSINECVSKELNFFLAGKDTKNLVTRNTQISGYNAVVINGVNNYDDLKYFWSFAVVPNEYYYYIIRVTSDKTSKSFNEYYNDEIIRSFNLKK
ncbi:MAG: hypothetical protein JXR68_01300 [Bacteroidales bacterium]|nr:hypothetical protein [Bacteroidales bacterium]